MAKNKNKQSSVTESQTTELQEEVQVEETVSPQEEVKPVTPAKKDSKNNKDNGKKNKKEKKQSKIGKKLKETTSELKKVNWPTFGQVVKKTGIVLAVVLIFAVILFGIDRLLSWLFGLLTGI